MTPNASPGSSEVVAPVWAWPEPWPPSWSYGGHLEMELNRPVYYYHIFHYDNFFQDDLVLKNEVCNHGHQLTTVLMSCNNIEETGFVI